MASSSRTSCGWVPRLLPPDSRSSLQTAQPRPAHLPVTRESGSPEPILNNTRRGITDAQLTSWNIHLWPGRRARAPSVLQWQKQIFRKAKDLAGLGAAPSPGVPIAVGAQLWGQPEGRATSHGWESHGRHDRGQRRGKGTVQHQGY